MATVLAISSEVVRGYVGNTAARRALQATGHEVWALPSIILSNHPAHAHAAGEIMSPDRIRSMLDALRANGWLGAVDAVSSGYLPSKAHVDVVADLVRELRGERDIRYHCDPIMGDDPKGLYIDAEAAAAIRSQLVELADVITPNRFELAWLSGLDVQAAEDAVTAARKLSVPTVVATSVPGPQPATITNICINTNLREGGWAGDRIDVPVIADAPHGTGDLLAALFLSYALNGETSADAFAAAVAAVEAAIRHSAGSDELRLSASRAWLEARPLTAQPLDL